MLLAPHEMVLGDLGKRGRGRARTLLPAEIVRPESQAQRQVKACWCGTLVFVS